MNSRFLAMALLASLACGAAPAALADPAAPAQVAVQYSPLDLQTAAGQRALKRRHTKAAQAVCPPQSSSDPWNRVNEPCVTRAVNQAMATLEERRIAGTPAVSGDRG